MKTEHTPYTCKTLYSHNDSASALFYYDTTKPGIHVRRLDDGKGAFTNETAAFIVHACNSHYELVAALAECIDALEFIENRTSTAYNPPCLINAKAIYNKANA